LIALASEIGISKKELFEDFYFDEFMILIKRKAELKKKHQEPQVEEVCWDQM